MRRWNQAAVVPSVLWIDKAGAHSLLWDKGDLLRQAAQLPLGNLGDQFAISIEEL